MSVNGKKIQAWVNDALPPLSWGVISMKMMRSFTKSGISPRAIDDSVMFDDELVAEMRGIVQQMYGVEIPNL